MVWPVDVERTLAVFVLGASRTLPLTWFLPVFGGPALPGPIRLGLGLGLGLLCFPLIATRTIPSGAVGWTALLFHEVVSGLVMGLVIGCLFRGIESAGRLTDILRGANLAEVISPVSEERSTPMGGLFLLLAVVVFWEIGGARYFATALAQSYEAMPLVESSQNPFSQRAALLVIAASAKLIESALALAAPVIVAMLIADLLLGALGRVAPGLPLFFVGMPAKALLGVGVVLVGLSALDTALAAVFRGFLALLQNPTSPGP